MEPTKKVRLKEAELIDSMLAKSGTKLNKAEYAKAQSIQLTQQHSGI